jgi:hypothetical protein
MPAAPWYTRCCPAKRAAWLRHSTPLIEEDGNARKYIDELRRWRDRLVGLHIE